MDVSARISHLEQVLKEKSTNLEQVSDAEVKEALRLEINNLRKTRDVLVEQRCNLDAKLNKVLPLITEILIQVLFVRLSTVSHIMM